jgi:site-specific DNA-methyltransferase (adenine-specific)
VTSPPYDALRTYRGVRKFNPHQVAAELLRVTVPGGVVVWIVNDQVIDGSESCSSFRQALAFRDCGWRLHDTMIYQRISPFPDSVRYHASFEYMFIFAHGSPRVFNRIADRRNGMPGKRIKGTERQADGTLKPFDRGAIRQEFGSRTNVWQCATGFRKTAPDAEVHEHPAAMPLRLAADHVRSWSNPGDTVLDCFSGSGQTAIAAELLDRRWIMIDVAEDYLGLAARRLAGMRANRQKFLDFCA